MSEIVVLVTCPVCKYPGRKALDPQGVLYEHPGRIAPCRPQPVSGTFVSDRVQVVKDPPVGRAAEPPKHG